MADLASQVNTALGAKQVRAEDVKVGQLVWFDSVGWRRISDRRVEGLRVIWNLTADGWAQRSLDETVSVLPEVLCDRCHGQGQIIRQHPSYGSRNCPSPTIEETCPTCGGSGRGW